MKEDGNKKVGSRVVRKWMSSGGREPDSMPQAGHTIAHSICKGERSFMGAIQREKIKTCTRAARSVAF